MAIETEKQKEFYDKAKKAGFIFNHGSASPYTVIVEMRLFQLAFMQEVSYQLIDGTDDIGELVAMLTKTAVTELSKKYYLLAVTNDDN